MNITGKVISQEDNLHIIELLKTKTTKELKLPNIFSVGNYLSVEIENDIVTNVKTLSHYKTIPTTELIFEDDQSDNYHIELLKPFNIFNCSSKEEAERDFRDLLRESSCNFVQNLKYIENTDDETYSVQGEIGLYSIVNIADNSLVDSFNNEFNNSLNIVNHNLEQELNNLIQEESLKEVCTKISLFMFGVVFSLIFFNVIVKYI